MEPITQKAFDGNAPLKQGEALPLAIKTLAVIACWLLAVCFAFYLFFYPKPPPSETPHFDIDRVELRMSRAEVLSILGKPDRTRESHSVDLGDSEEWYYGNWELDFRFDHLKEKRRD